MEKMTQVGIAFGYPVYETDTGGFVAIRGSLPFLVEYNAVEFFDSKSDNPTLWAGDKYWFGNSGEVLTVCKDIGEGWFLINDQCTVISKFKGANSLVKALAEKDVLPIQKKD